MRTLYNTKTKREVKIPDDLYFEIMNDKIRSKNFSEIVLTVEDVKVVDEVFVDIPEPAKSDSKPKSRKSKNK